MNGRKVLLFGSDYMADEYLKVLKHLGCEVVVVGRNAAKAEALAGKYGMRGLGGGAAALASIEAGSIDLTIIASAIESLKELTLASVSAGLKNILLEKPGALDRAELAALGAAIGRKARVVIAYNRRYYNSVIELKRRIAAEGGPLGCFFDFTDREKDVLTSGKNEKVVSRWGFANSSHVIDTAFYLAGRPVELECRRSGGWAVHPSGTAFAGSGRTERCLFSYFAAWAGGGRWAVEIATDRGRYKLSPMETLQFCKKDQFAWETIAPADEDDVRFKPGLMKMVGAALLGENNGVLPDLAAQAEFCGTIDRIFGYDK